jgi:hypothetical protein
MNRRRHATGGRKKIRLMNGRGLTYSGDFGASGFGVETC